MKTENTNCIVVEREGRIVLVKRRNKTFHGYWCFPGGHAERGETMHHAAQRESNEEIGLVKVEPQPFMIFEHDWPADTHIMEPHRHRCHAFRAVVTGRLRAGDDAAELGWFTTQEAKKLRLTEYTKIILNHLYRI